MVSQGAIFPMANLNMNGGPFGFNRSIVPNVPTPELTLQTNTFVDNITGLSTSNRTQFMPDATGQICVTGLVGCKYFVDTGAANVYVITPANPAISALVDGMDFTIKPAHANTGASTLQVGSTSAFSIKKNGVSTDPVANDILPKYDFEVKWDATDSVWLLTSNPGNGGGGGGSGTVNNSAVANTAAYYAGIGTAVSPLAVGALEQYAEGIDSGTANVYVITTTPIRIGAARGWRRIFLSSAQRQYRKLDGSLRRHQHGSTAKAERLTAPRGRHSGGRNLRREVQLDAERVDRAQPFILL